MKSEDSTPEWFQLAQADGYEPKPQGKKVLRMMALTAPLLVLGAGLVFAQTQDSPVATASTATAASSTSTDPISLSSTPAASTPAASTPAASTPAAAPTSASAGNAISISQTSSVAPSAKASITIKKPAITMPTGAGEDDGLRTSDDD